MIEEKRYPYEPDYAVPPGRTLRETIAALGMDQRELAIRTGLDKKTINQIVQGLHPLSQETAIKLERATGVPARMWNNLEMQYRERLERQKDHERLQSELEWLKQVPVGELVRRGVVQETKDKVSLLRQVLSFFGVRSTAEWLNLWEKNLACQFRRSRAFAMRPGPTAAWIRLGELEGQRVDCRPYDRSRFVATLREIRGLTTSAPETWQPRMVELCAPCGVAVVFIPEIRGCPASGLTRWLTPDKALMQLSLRYKTDDHFWFTFFHEAGHILHDPKRVITIEDGGQDQAEERADRFATDFLIPREHLPELASLRSYTGVVAFSKRLGIAAGIVVGQMQRRNLAPYTHLNRLKRRLAWTNN